MALLTLLLLRVSWDELRAVIAVIIIVITYYTCRATVFLLGIVITVITRVLAAVDQPWR